MRLRTALVLVLGVFAFTACGGDDGGSLGPGGKKDTASDEDVANPYQDVFNHVDGSTDPDTISGDDTATDPDEGGCTNACTLGETQCMDAASLRTCIQATSGCTVWGAPTACPNGQACDTANDTCGSTTVERKCTDQEMQAFQGCFTACAQGDTTCQQGCLGQLSPVCESAFMAFVQCAQASGCGQDEACIATACAAEIEAVYGGGGTVQPSDCDPITDQGCQAGQNCSMVSQTALGCVPAGTALIDQPCGQGAGADCADGVCLSADGVNYTCAQFCSAQNNTCPAGRPCNIGMQGSDYTFCGALPVACDLLAQDCPNNQGCYMIDQAGTTDCAPSQGKTAGQPCSYLNDCAPGHICGNNPGTCYQICNLGGGAPACATGQCQNAQLPVANAGVCQ